MAMIVCNKSSLDSQQVLELGSDLVQYVWVTNDARCGKQPSFNHCLLACQEYLNQPVIGTFGQLVTISQLEQDSQILCIDNIFTKFRMPNPSCIKSIALPMKTFLVTLEKKNGVTCRNPQILCVQSARCRILQYSPLAQ